MKSIFIILAASAIAAHAGPRGSANYTITADTIDSGGGRATAAMYTNDSGIAPIAGISHVAAPSQTAKHGYAGQLYDVTGLMLNAPAPEVNETATLQLAAWQQLDDSTLLSVPANLIAWSVINGPLTGISLTGLAAAGTVFQDTPATVGGDLGSHTGILNLTVHDSIPDNFGSYAADGLDDDWQVQYFGLDNPLAAPLLDPDGDGQNNHFEFTAGLVPTDPLSRFVLTIEEVPGQPGHKQLKFSPALPDRIYTVQFNLNLTGESWENLTDMNDDNQQPERTVIDLNASDSKKFYKVEIVKP